MRFIAIVVTFFFMAHLAYAEKMAVQVAEQNTARQGEPLHFGALVVGEPINSEIADRLYSVVIYPEIMEDKEVTLTNQEIALTLRRTLSFQDLQSLSLKIPENVKVRFKRNHLSINLVKQNILKAGQSICPTCEFEIKGLKLPELTTSDEILNLTLDTSRLQNGGSFLLPLSVETSRGRVNQWVTGQLLIWNRSPVALRQIKPGQKIEDGDFEVRRVNVSMSKDGVAVADQLIGKSVNRVINMGQAIFQGDLKRDPAVQRGQTVQLRLGTDDFEITSSGVAEENGFIGDLIKVRSTESKTALSGVLIEKGVVKVQ